ASVFESYECEILVVDDASKDRTFEIGQEYQHSHPEIRMTVLRNEFNQGYGGNQKVGYTFAIANGFDFVAMVHGDGQYAPEELPHLLEPLREDQADAVFGSRMLQPFGALKGGMPLYKYVGNKILTKLQNTMLGTRLSEFHSGYRIYRVKSLDGIQYRLNSNDFHFDTEIIIQLFNARARMVERPIPTYYGDEICRVNGMKYAKDVLSATLQNVAHRSGLLYQRRFDPRSETNEHYDLKLGYASSHTYALQAVKPSSKVLDIGAGPGGIARELRKLDCDVTVVDQHAPTVKSSDVKVIVQDIDEPPKFDAREYEYLLLLDVIEHLKDPEQFIARLRAQFDYQPKKLVLSTPNVAFIVQRLMLLGGQFNYGKAGILDRTHTRLFTFRAIQHLLRDAGFRIKAVKGVPVPFPKVFGNGIFGRAALNANLALIALSKSLFAYQIFIEAETTPDVDFVVSDAAVRSGVHERVSQLRQRA
ncbi:MAG TPA: bifunctional glycosyltransferase/class I SAM-dependent methyltransferase, partial [Polyangiaceae bacterium]|nr:bifunctional glycosyltransferase/class I SAM-dependent methyltransferase [Polyangiaceae bacterium]